jgi:hypothetical protein
MVGCRIWQAGSSHIFRFGRICTGLMGWPWLGGSSPEHYEKFGKSPKFTAATMRKSVIGYRRKRWVNTRFV